MIVELYRHLLAFISFQLYINGRQKKKCWWIYDENEWWSGLLSSKITHVEL